MATYNNDVELGVTAGVALIPGFATYIENGSGTTPGSSLTTVTEVSTGNNAELTGNAGSLTARNLTYYCSTFDGGDLNNSSPMTFENCSIHIGDSVQRNLAIPMTWTNVDFFNNADDTSNFLWGTFGNGSGTYGVLDADGHITTAGTSARGLSRPMNWTNVRIFCAGGLRMVVNGARPGQSSFSNVDFNPAPGRGAFGELPFLPFSDARWGQFYRTDNFPNTGDILFARLTGGMDRNNLNINTNWMIQPQWDIRNLDGETAQVAVDGRCFVYFVNFNLPADASNLTLRGGQGTSSTSSGQNGPTRIISCYGWNPLVNGGTNDVKYIWDNSGSANSFAIHTVPATFTGGNTDGTAVQPAVFTTGSTEPANFNGFFIIQEDTGSLTDNARAAGETITQYTTRDVHIFSYESQVNTVVGTTFNANFGRAITLVPNAHEINADLTWRQEQVIDEAADVFLNGRTAGQGGTNVDITTLEHLYPTLKSVAFDIGSLSDDRFNIAPFEGGLRFLGDVTFDATRTNSISGTTGAFIIRLQDSNTGVGVVPILNFTTLPGTGGHNVDWTVNTRTFDAPITIVSGVHSNFPLDWTNGLTFGGAVEIARPAAGTVLDWTNVEIPDGVTVRFPGTSAFSILGLTAAEQGRITGTGITFLDNPIINTLRITARAGWLGVRIDDVEAVAPRRFTTAEITAGQVEFTLSDQTSPDGAAFGNLTSASTVEMFVKYDSTPDLANSVVYQEQYQTVNYDSVTTGTVLPFTQTQPVPLTLVSAASAAAPTRFVVEQVSSSADGQVQLRNPAGDVAFNPLSNGDTLSGAIQLGNLQTTFNSFYNNRATTTNPITVYGQGNITTFDGDRLSIRSGNRPGGTPPFVQHIVSGWESTAGTTLFPTTNNIVEIINQSPGLAIVPVDTIISGVDASATASRVQNAERGVGYVVGDTDNDGNPVGTRSRFAGIRPKRAVYNTNTSYEDIL